MRLKGWVKRRRLDGQGLGLNSLALDLDGGPGSFLNNGAEVQLGRLADKVNDAFLRHARDRNHNDGVSATTLRRDLSFGHTQTVHALANDRHGLIDLVLSDFTLPSLWLERDRGATTQVKSKVGGNRCVRERPQPPQGKREQNRDQNAKGPGWAVCRGSHARHPYGELSLALFAQGVSKYRRQPYVLVAHGQVRRVTASQTVLNQG